MALKKTITARNNFGTETTLPNTYIKVDSVHGGKQQMHAKVVYMAPTKDTVYFERSFEFQPTVGENSKDFIAQAYDHLQTLPEFEGAEAA